MNNKKVLVQVLMMIKDFPGIIPGRAQSTPKRLIKTRKGQINPKERKNQIILLINSSQLNTLITELTHIIIRGADLLVITDPSHPEVTEVNTGLFGIFKIPVGLIDGEVISNEITEVNGIDLRATYNDVPRPIKLLRVIITGAAFAKYLIIKFLNNGIDFDF